MFRLLYLRHRAPTTRGNAVHPSEVSTWFSVPSRLFPVHGQTRNTTATARHPTTPPAPQSFGNKNNCNQCVVMITDGEDNASKAPCKSQIRGPRRRAPRFWRIFCAPTAAHRANAVAQRQYSGHGMLFFPIGTDNTLLVTNCAIPDPRVARRGAAAARGLRRRAQDDVKRKKKKEEEQAKDGSEDRGSGWRIES